MGRSIAIAVFAAALSVAGSFAAHAAGLGKITVLSSLGQPLNAEIDIVSVQAGEDEGLTARLAPPESFQQQGIDFNSALAGMRFSIVRKGGHPIVKVTSTQAVNEPFLEMLVELQWNTGRLVREYTFLLDPPEYKGPQAVAAAPAQPAAAAAAPAMPAEQPSAPAEAAPTEPTPIQPVPSEQASTPSQPIESKPLEATPAESAPAAPSAPAAAAAPAVPPEAQYQVKKGDTLGAIARQHMAAGVTLEQMLIAIYRANPDAFIRDNVNLVRAGKILNIPGEVSDVDPADAKRLVRAHNADFNAYRSRLAAAAPAAAEGTPPGSQEAAGPIEPKPEAAKPAPKEDQLRLSKSEPGKPSAPGARAAKEDDLIARDRALKEAQSRQAELEKNVADLQKLLELKNQQLAELEKKAAKPAAAAPLPTPAPAAKAPEKPAAPPATPPTAAPKAPEAAPAAPTPPAQAPKPAAEAPKPATEAAKPAPPAAKPQAPKPAAKKAAPAPAQEPSIINEFLDNPVALGALGGVILLLVGYGAWAWRRKKRSQAKFQDSVLDAASSAGAASVFGTPGAAGAASGSTASVSQAPAGMEAEEVDPIAEADVYMAYGRDAQAEEILKEALGKDPNRTPVLAKLLEIYAHRKDAKSFEQHALKLKSLTNSAGPEWDKAASLGRAIDPQNGLYGGSAGSAATAAAAAPAAAAPMLDFDIGGAPAAGSAPDITLDALQKDATAPSVDFDLGAAAGGAPAETPQSDFTPEGTLIMGKEAEKADAGLDFDLGLGGDSKPEPAPAPAAEKPADTSGLDFDLNLDMGGDKPAEASAPAASSMDLSSISLDLGGSADATASGSSSDPKWQEVATKLDLAKAYEEMGDKDGARELLSEVMKDGDAAQKGQAQQLLAKLG